MTTRPSGTAGTMIQSMGCRRRKVTRGMTKSQDKEGCRRGRVPMYQGATEEPCSGGWPAHRERAREATAPTKVTVQCRSATRLRKDELTVATQLGPSQGGVSCAWGPPGGLLALKIHVQRRTDGAWRLQHRLRHVLAAPATTHIWWKDAGRDWGGWAKPVAFRRYCAADGPVVMGRDIVGAFSSRKPRCWAPSIARRQTRGPTRKSNFGGSRCST